MKVCLICNDFKIDNSSRSAVKSVNSLHFCIAMMVPRTVNGSTGMWIHILAIFLPDVVWILDDPRNQLLLDRVKYYSRIRPRGQLTTQCPVTTRSRNETVRHAFVCVLGYRGGCQSTFPRFVRFSLWFVSTIDQCPIVVVIFHLWHPTEHRKSNGSLWSFRPIFGDRPLKAHDNWVIVTTFRLCFVLDLCEIFAHLFLKLMSAQRAICLLNGRERWFT
jgi:hypothetical protein